MGITIRASKKTPVTEPSCQVRLLSSQDLSAFLPSGRSPSAVHVIILYDGGNLGDTPRRLDVSARRTIKKALEGTVRRQTPSANAVRWSWRLAQAELNTMLADPNVRPEEARSRLAVGQPLDALNRQKSFSEHYSLVASPSTFAEIVDAIRQTLSSEGFHFEEIADAKLQPGEQELIENVERFLQRIDGIVALPRQALSRPTDKIVRALQTAKNVVLEGVPGTGKSHTIATLRTACYSDRVTTLVMHPSIGYEDLIEGLRPQRPIVRPDDARQTQWFFEQQDSVSPESVATPPFGVVAGGFLRACVQACEQWPTPHLVVLDEINRCNVPRALGELLFLLEPSKRMTKRDIDGSWQGGESAWLPYSGRRFFVPSNLHVLGTMNTTDRSTAPLDSALRRRFAFIRLDPMDANELTTALSMRNLQESISAWERLNAVLRMNLGPEFVLGHSYFFEVKSQIDVNQTEADSLVCDMWQNKLLPQLADLLTLTNRQDLLNSELRDPLQQVQASTGLTLALEGSGALQSFTLGSTRGESMRADLA